MKVWVRQGRASGGHRSCSPKFIMVLLALGLASTAYAETIVIDSGIDADFDGLDDTVRYLAGPADSGFPNAFTPSDFAAAQSGPAAPVVTSPAGVWVPSHSTSDAARWIGTSSNAVQGGSALYHVPFTLSAVPQSVVLEFRYAIDDRLGDPVNQGLFVNGTPISGYGSGPPGGDFSAVTTLNFDITEHVNAGLNHLYVYQYDWGDHAGAQFTVALTVEYGNTIIIDSGIDADFDGLDDTVHYLAGPADSGFPNAFTPSDFVAAQSGPAARVVTNPAGVWVPNHSTSDAARWIGTSSNAVQGDSALYHVPFSLSAVPQSVVLEFRYAIDDRLGDPVNQGLFVNGTAISGYGSGPPGGDFSAVTTLNFDITEHVNPGLNHLYIYGYDWGDHAGAQFTVVISVGGAQTCFEDGFDGPTLDPAWDVMGTGSYSLTGGDLEFVTETGDLVDLYEDSVGPPRHMFLVDPDSSLTRWSAVARVRYNTPNESFEQVVVLAYQDNDNYVKVSYNYWETARTGFLAEYNGNFIPMTVAPLVTQTDYFWLRLDRDGNNYTAYVSSDITTDADAVQWTYAGSSYAELGDSPRVGIGGWNGDAGRSGELAEFDYFRLRPLPHFEDGFDGPTLDPAWDVMGAGSYSLTGGDLEFVTETGDLVDLYEDSVGPPRHMFLVDPGSCVTQWSALARVRYNTPDESFEQVVVLAYQDNDNYVKVSYNYWEAARTGYLAEYNGNFIPMTVAPLVTQTDYFWLRLDRDGNDYRAYVSSDITTDANAVQWTYAGSSYAELGDSPRVGIGGWNGDAGRSGELAEFDYFRLEPLKPLLYRLTCWATSSRGLIGVDPYAENYDYSPGTEVTLTAYPFSGYVFKHWILYDPNYPRDANYVVTDSNNPIVVVMNSDRQVKASFGCGSGIEQVLPVLAIVGVFCGVASWRRRR